MTKRLHLKIYGQVQGVFFRQETQKLAESLKLSGFVKNLPDRTVEICAEGNEESLQKLALWAKTGPELAKVEKVEADWRKTPGNFSDFQVK